jgi:protoheme IX farnesyltransferase
MIVSQVKTSYSSFTATISDYLTLMKPWIVLLLLTTTLAAMLVAARGFPPFSILVITLLGGALTSGGSNALNSYIDRDIDPQMGRTARRPIPSGRIAPRRALIFGFGSIASGFGLLFIFVNPLSAFLSLIGAFYYVVIYTLVLKRRTPHNVVIGGAAGAIPPLVGWAAVTGELNLLAALMFLVIFAWTPPHTWALMLLVAKDYAHVNVPMMPVARGEASTRRQIVGYALALIAVTLLPFFVSTLGAFYLIVALALGGRFFQLAMRLMRDGEKSTARKLYIYSNLYLALLFLAMVIDHSALPFFFS